LWCWFPRFHWKIPAHCCCFEGKVSDILLSRLNLLKVFNILKDSYLSM
jgi:hypothetical protein